MPEHSISNEPVSANGTSTAHVALCCNGTMLPGLHATVASLVKNLSRRKSVSLNLFIQDFNQAELDSLCRTVTKAGGVGTLNFHQADLSDFNGLKTLQGDLMPYLRLNLPKLMPEADIILYLDSDVIVNTDACAIFDCQLGNSPLGAIYGCTVEWALDHAFLKLVGLTDQDRSFNSGVLLFNAKLWRKLGYVDQALEMARSYSDVLTSHDQSVLNGLFSRTFHGLPGSLNTFVVPTEEPFALADGIYHFVGSPKPWDPLGRLSHGNWQLWQTVIEQTDFKWSAFLSRHLPSYCGRAWTLRRSYLRNILRK